MDNVQPFLTATTPDRVHTACGRILAPGALVERVRRMTRYNLDTETVQVSSLAKGESVLLVAGQEAAELPPPGRTPEGELGYLLGLLVGDGTFSSTKATLCVWLPKSGPSQSTPSSADEGKHQATGKGDGEREYPTQDAPFGREDTDERGPVGCPVPHVHHQAQNLMTASSESRCTDASAEVRARAEAALRTLPYRSDFKGWFVIDHPTTVEMRMSTKALRSLAHGYGIAHGHKTITPQVMGSPPSFQAAFLAGLFDADGTVGGTQAKGVSVRLAQSDIDLLRNAQIMLERLGINSTLYANRRPAGERLLPDGKGGQALYTCQADHELVIAGANIARFEACVGFMDTAKRTRLAQALGSYKRALNRERWVATITTNRGYMNPTECGAHT
jgi:LAGLIDADG-like domain